MDNIRIEQDSLGPVQVPASAPYAAQTQRAINLYGAPIGQRLCDFPLWLDAMLGVKQACVLANQRTGYLASDEARALNHVLEQLRQSPTPAYFPVNVLGGAGGVSLNMNLNEVLANLANQQLPGAATIHPNEQPNLNHSTSDWLSTSAQWAVLRQWRALSAALEHLIAAWQDRRDAVAGQSRLARTCLQDAVEIDAGRFIDGYIATLTRGRDRLDAAAQPLLAVNLGGSLVGREQDIPQSVFNILIDCLNEVSDGFEFHSCDDLIDASQNLDRIGAFVSELTVLARQLIKLARDSRLLASGPECGLAEWQLPAVAPGSSALPGKINPSIPEYLIQSAMSALGQLSGASMALEMGELDYNPWLPAMTAQTLSAIEQLTAATQAYAQHCVSGIQMNAQINQDNVNSSMPVLVRLRARHGYERATQLAKQFHGNPQGLRRAEIDLANQLNPTLTETS